MRLSAPATRYIVSLIFLGVTVAQATAASVYLIGGGDSSYNGIVRDALTAHGQTVTVGDPYDTFDGATPLASYDAVLLMPAFGGQGGDMPTSGQNSLLAYVNNGGGLVTTEWSLWLTGSGGRLATLSPCFPAVSDGTYDYYPSTAYSRDAVDPVIDYNLPDSSYTFSLADKGGTESQLTTQVLWDGHTARVGS